MSAHSSAKPHAKRKSQAFLLQERRNRVAQMYLRGISQSEIGAKEGIDQSTVSTDLKVIRQQWLAESLDNYDEKVARELAKLDMLEAAAWTSWERSLEDDVTVSTSEKQELRTEAQEEVQKALEKKVMKLGKPKMVVVQKDTKESRTGQVGDPRFLEVIRGCIGDRRKLLGLDKEKEESGKGVTVINVNWDGMTGRSRIVDPVEQRKLLPESSPEEEK